MVFFTFGLTDLVGGSGFLAVYLAGIVLGNHEFLHKRSLVRFHDGLAWLVQIAMFLTLGLLVFPSQLVPIIGVGLLMAACLMFLARPIAVFVSLLPGALSWREKTFVSWVGLRGAVPIILATFPLLAGIPQANLIFNLVFFIVLTSVLLQGTTLPLVARWLRVDAPAVPRRVYPIEYTPVGGFKSELKELPVPPGSYMAGKAIFEMGLPADFLVVLIARENDFMVPTGGTVVRGGDTLLALADKETFAAVQATLELPTYPASR
jgi:cell volume regulation protein A